MIERLLADLGLARDLSDALAYACDEVIAGAPAMLVVHEHRRDELPVWQVLCGGEHDWDAPDIPLRLVHLGHLVACDGDLRRLFDLPPGWEAERNRRGSWVRRPHKAA